MKISAVYITKNEEKNIEKSILSCKDAVDEVIIVDTGSTDKTIEICKRLNCKIFNFKWCDDFSKARNYAISLCSNEIILFLDADEYFETPLTIQNREDIISIFEDKKQETDAIGFAELDIDKDSKLPNHTGYTYKVFKNSPNIYFEGVIHEVLIHAKRELNICLLNGVKLIHTGYSKSVSKSKVERNLELLNKLKSKRVIDYYYLARENLSIQNFEEAEKNINILFSQKGFYKMSHTSNIGYLSYIYKQEIMHHFNDKYSLKDELKILEAGVREFPYIPEMYYRLGIFYFQIDLDKSMKMFKKAMKVNEDFQGKHFELNNFLSFQPNLYYYMSKIHMLQGRKNDAIRTAIVSCMLDNRNELHAGLLLHLLNRSKTQANIELLRKTFKLKNKEDYEFIVKLLSNCNLTSEFIYFANIYNNDFKGGNDSVYYAMMLTGEFKTALDSLKEFDNNKSNFIKTVMLLYANSSELLNDYIGTLSEEYIAIINFIINEPYKAEIFDSQLLVDVLCKLATLDLIDIPKEVLLKTFSYCTEEQICFLSNAYMNNNRYSQALRVITSYCEYMDDNITTSRLINQLLLIYYALEDYTNVIKLYITYKDILSADDSITLLKEIYFNKKKQLTKVDKKFLSKIIRSL